MGTQHRGFASMDKAKQREIASKGGKAAHQQGTAHQWTSEEAKIAGRKGGTTSRGGRGRLGTAAPEIPEIIDPIESPHINHDATNPVQ